MFSEEHLIEMMKTWIGEHGQVRGPMTVKEDMDLLASGALDSMGFIELLAYIESETGHPIDLGTLDVRAFTSMQTLAAHVVRTSTGAEKHG